MKRNQTRPLTQDAVTPHTSTPAVHLHTDTPVVHVVTDTPVQLFTGCAVVDVDDDGRQLSSTDVRSVERNPDIETLGELLTDDDSGVSLISVKTTGIVTFRVSRRRREMYCGRARLCVCLSCLSVCLSAAACLYYCTDPDVTSGSKR